LSLQNNCCKKHDSYDMRTSHPENIGSHGILNIKFLAPPDPSP
jgi:hypothetical protein